MRQKVVWGEFALVSKLVAGELVFAYTNLNDSYLGSLLEMAISKVRFAFSVFFNFNFLRWLPELV